MSGLDSGLRWRYGKGELRKPARPRPSPCCSGPYGPYNGEEQMIMKRRTTMILLTIFLLLVLTGCIPGDGTHTTSHPAGFFWGIWHGWLAPLSLIIKIFNKSIRIYEPLNSGWLYDFGYYMAVVSGFGGLSLFRKRRKSGEGK